MSRDLVLIPREMSVRAAAHALSMSRVSGAPVVDDNGRCIGVISTTNFVEWAHKAHALKCPIEPVYHSAWQLIDHESLPSDRVESYMTSDVVTAPPSTPIVRLARMMLDAHIHRIIVVDRQGKPMGIVTSTDILATVAQGNYDDYAEV
jgi:CBS-domain-containing membrane protein